MRPTRDAVVTTVLASLLLVVAFNLQAGWVYAMVALLAGLLVAGALTAWVGPRGITVQRTGPHEAFEGDRIAVTLALRTSRWPRLFVSVRDEAPGLEPVRVFVPLLLPGRSQVITYQTTAVRRGDYRGGTVTVSSHGLAGMVRATRSVDVSASLTVFPRYRTVRRFPHPGDDRVAEEHSPARSRGGTEFRGIREYREGDSLRRVHWRSTAKRGQLIIREFEDEAAGGATLLLDTRANGADEAFEDLIRAAASVAHYLTRSGGRVRIIAGQQGGVLDITGGWRDALYALARVNGSGDVLPAFVVDVAGLPASSAVILFTHDAAAVETVSHRGDPVVVVPSLASLEASA